MTRPRDTVFAESRDLEGAAAVEKVSVTTDAAEATKKTAHGTRGIRKVSAAHVSKRLFGEISASAQTEKFLVNRRFRCATLHRSLRKNPKRPALLSTLFFLKKVRRTLQQSLGYGTTPLAGLCSRFPRVCCVFRLLSFVLLENHKGFELKSAISGRVDKRIYNDDR